MRFPTCRNLVPILVLATCLPAGCGDDDGGPGGSGVPAAPDNLAAAPLSSTSIGLSWRDNSGNETGFRIERSQNQPWATVATVGPDQVFHVDQGLLPDNTYTYRVIATNGAGDSAPSNYVTASTPARTLPPGR